ncbi:tetratricopeptide repeat protein [Phenylobacterium sp.]|uniref:tetratricopeptide repeat protein n=1 Tax=Phenylobacterium sp. TaxID=1871053 RepID=UPI00272F0A9C|nr:hypothetical protein [Phenylobacterium sp.]MDP1874458.1 hypothetical protein [Phenylobacterium sp.]
MHLTVLGAATAFVLGILIGGPVNAATPQAEASFRAGQQAAGRSDAVTARREYERACDSGHLSACTLLAARVADGVGGPADPRRARQLFAKACVVNIAWSAASVADACLLLGDMYMEGEGGPKQPARAAYLYARACDIGAWEACDALAVLMADGEVIPLNADDMVATIVTRACATADLEHCEEFYEAGLIAPGQTSAYAGALQTFRDAHRQPAGTPPSRKKALLTQACDGGMARACARAAWEWQHGFQNMPVDPQQALRLYLLACALGDGAACDEVGDALRMGSGVPKNLADAADAYSFSCQAAYPPGCRSLAAMHQRGDIAADLPLARALERFVCESGWGCVSYADMLTRGLGGPPDRARARQVLQAECDDVAFSSSACEVLARLGG